MTTPYTPPKYRLDSFNCPDCGAYAHQEWNNAAPYQGGQYYSPLKHICLVKCSHCDGYSVWVNSRLIYPFTGTAPLPNPDTPEDVRIDYEEARNIVSLSPRGAAAILRLAIQKLCIHLGGKGENLNTDIGKLVANGLPEKLQKALDSVRVIGNNAVHPGQIDLSDDIETAQKLFVFINIICENQITQQKLIDTFYESIPENLKEAINRRDGK